jgi:hypothetical protein
MSTKFQKIVAFAKRVGPGLQKAYEAYSTTKELKGQYDALGELADADDTEREKLVREIAGIDSYLDGPIAAAQEARTNLEALAGAKIEWPEDAEGDDLYAAGLMAVYENGKGSKQAKAAWTAFGKHCYTFGDKAQDILNELSDLKDALKSRHVAAQGLVDVTSRIDGLLQAALKVPLPSTLQATLFAASEDAETLRSLAQVIQQSLKTIGTTIDTGIKDGNALVARNTRWLAWASKAADIDVQVLRKLAKAKTP